MRVFDFLALQQALPACEFVDAHAEISSIRLHKTAAEIAKERNARRAATIPDAPAAQPRSRIRSPPSISTASNSAREP